MAMPSLLLPAPPSCIGIILLMRARPLRRQKPNNIKQSQQRFERDLCLAKDASQMHFVLRHPRPANGSLVLVGFSPMHPREGMPP